MNMADQLPDANPDVPRVVLARRVIDKMLRGALLYPEPETGEAMVGLVVPQAGRTEPDIYVLDTISPGEHAVREWGLFEQGSEWQGDVFHWLYVNWEAFRDLRRPSYGRALAAKWDVPLSHVGDWHKQPGDMTEPSVGDAQTARRMIDDSETPVEHIVAPIVTLYRLRPAQAELSAAPASEQAAEEEPSQTPDVSVTSEEPIAPGVMDQETADQMSDKAAAEHKPPWAIIETLEDKGWIVRIDFWYMSKRAKRFAPVTPVVWPDDRLPGLPPVAWHLQHPRRFDQEYNLLTEAGYAIDVVRWDADGRPPYEICFSVYKPGSKHVFVLVTPVDYPAQMPALRVAPLVRVEEDEDVFEKLYTTSKPVLMNRLPDWAWDSKRTLVELVWHVEQTLDEDGA
jgi:hypothetical protein